MRRHRRRLRLLRPALLYATIAALAAAPSAWAATDLNGVVDNFRLWLTGALAGIATVYVMVGGARYMLAGGDPVKIERAKLALHHAGMGYAFALFAPVVVAIIQRIVGQ